jgi:peptidylprolyl isomerase
MSQTKVSHRIAAIVLALLFLVTSLGFSGLVIWEMHQENRRNKANQNTNQNTTQNKSIENKTKEGKLEGTKLADFTPGEAVTELQKIDLTEGTGDEVQAGETITAHYTGALVSTGVIFQSSHDAGQPFTSALSGLIQGWQEGIPGMKVGGKRRLIIPAAKAYGAQSQNGIPANSDLVFDIELVSINK